MKYAIICSEKDPAAMNIKRSLADSFGFEKLAEKHDGREVYGLGKSAKLYTTGKDSIYCDDIDKEIGADLFIFATRHQASSGVPCFTAHAPGNWGNAEMGGDSRTLGVAPAAYLRHSIRKFVELAKPGFEVVQEATHHGPRISKPCLFVEIGSAQKEWIRKDAADIVAEVIFGLIKENVSSISAAVGVGGPHYCPNFKKIVLNEDIGLGHICPKHALESLDAEMLSQALKSTFPEANAVVLDWKGLGSHKQRLMKLCEALGIESRRTSDY